LCVDKYVGIRERITATPIPSATTITKDILTNVITPGNDLSNQKILSKIANSIRETYDCAAKAMLLEDSV
jgi:hypothetical protein